jgi:hypothetical protein
VSGSARNGVWAARVRIGTCFKFGPSVPVRLRVTDVAANHPSIKLPNVHVSNGHTSDPATAWRFSEPVHGISTAHVDVIGPAGTKVPGTWRCRDGHRRRTSCLHGSVMRATFWRTQKLYLDYLQFEVWWEPERHLEVLDRAGNPTLFAVTNATD